MLKHTKSLVTAKIFKFQTTFCFVALFLMRKVKKLTLADIQSECFYGEKCAQKYFVPLVIETVNKNEIASFIQLLIATTYNNHTMNVKCSLRS